MTTKTNDSLTGVLALLLTPFQQNGAIDWTTYDAYVDWQLEREPTGLFAVCGSSEMKWLTAQERVDLARRAVQRAGDIPVFATANLGEDSATHRDELARMADTGIAAAVLVPPRFSHDRARYRDYLFMLTEDAPCPIVLYEWPQMDNHLLEPELFGELAQCGRIVGIKDTTCTLEGIRAKQAVAGDAVVYQANTPFLLAALKMGVRGIMAITSTARADLGIQLWRQFQQQEDAAQRTHRELVSLDGLLRLAYPATAKHLVARQGIQMSTHTRAPSTLTAEMIKALDVWQGLA